MRRSSMLTGSASYYMVEVEVKKAKRLFNQWFFNYLHRNNLVYSTCWEDPRIDRDVMNLDENDVIMVITSGGCNALEYTLDNPKHVYAVDINPRQNALLELKKAGIITLDYDTYFQIFGKGHHPDFKTIYRKKLRRHLSMAARNIWDDHLSYFDESGIRKGFYFRGLSGVVALFWKYYINAKNVRDAVYAAFQASSLREQADIYFNYIYDAVWKGLVRRVTGTSLYLALVGVPPAQRLQVEQSYLGGVAKYVSDCMESIFTRLPLKDNYFWWVYINGSYTKHRCPEYLKEENFYRLKDGLVDRVSVHTSTVTNFLKSHRGKISKYVLLDHMDWLANYDEESLAEEWQAIIDTITDDGQVLYRSGGLYVDYVDPIQVKLKGKRARVGDLFVYDDEMAQRLHKLDRVHTYGSFYAGTLCPT